MFSGRNRFRRRWMIEKILMIPSLVPHQHQPLSPPRTYLHQNKALVSHQYQPPSHYRIYLRLKRLRFPHLSQTWSLQRLYLHLNQVLRWPRYHHIISNQIEPHQILQSKISSQLYFFWNHESLYKLKDLECPHATLWGKESQYEVPKM